MPSGWIVEDIDRRYTAIIAPRPCGALAVTIDFKMRVYRSGAATTGKPLHTKMYGGARWKHEIIVDAIAWLKASVA